ncbi:MAG: DNA alkylation repair protein [Bacillota bacterium]|nr:DNA alkylation repair protein [Bacillota bacterium]
MDIFEIFYSSANPEQAVKMAAYMKNIFPFLGIPKPLRANLSKNFIKQRKKDNLIDWEFIHECYTHAEREFHYLALDYLIALKKLLTPEDLPKIEKLIVTNSWWDSSDCIDALFGDLCIRFPEAKETALQWAKSENIWLKRVAIDFQLQYKDKTDPELLGRVIQANLDTGEFFINKAIGWALREYSKTNKEWVGQFISENRLSTLSVREASKYL